MGRPGRAEGGVLDHTPERAVNVGADRRPGRAEGCMLHRGFRVGAKASRGSTSDGRCA